MRNTKQILLIVLLAAVFSAYAGLALAATLNVPSTEYPTIQSAISAAVGGDTVSVAEGTYYENINFLGKAITVTSVNGQNSKDSTIIDGGGTGSVVKFGSGEGSGSVLIGFTIRNGAGTNYGGYKGGGIFCYASSSPTISHCIITDNDVPSGHGGGIACYGASPSFDNCDIENNNANNGGGIASMGESSKPVFDDCSIGDDLLTTADEGNTATNDGGGIYIWNKSELTLINCDIIGNSAGHSGGGMWFLYQCYGTITNCTISGNTAVSSGGGIGSYSNANDEEKKYTIVNSTISGNSAHSGAGIFGNSYFFAVITNCIIGDDPDTTTDEGNKTDVSDGGGIYCKSNSDLALSKCTVLGNFSTRDGGGIQLDQSTATITNCIISDNTASRLGGGIHALNSSPTKITNCTIANNYALVGGGLRCTNGSPPTIINTIVYFNDPDQIVTINSNPTVTYSNVEGGYTGTGNTDVEPIFEADNCETYKSDYALADVLQQCCIDKGNNTNAPSDDICGNSRPQDGDGDQTATTDMGAYEYMP